MMIKKEEIGEHLKQCGVKPSYQRMRIFEYLVNNRVHPTVDIIYKSLLPEIPTLSKTTVYNTLNLFIEKKLVNTIVIEENEVRYDIDTTLHGHFKCDVCNAIYDFTVDPSYLEQDYLRSFNISEQHIYLKGACKSCSPAHL